MSPKLRIALATPIMLLILFYRPHWIGAWVQSVGFGLNVIALSVNGWKMPVKGMAEEYSRSHVPANENTRLGILCDWIITPLGTFSAGDCLLILGNLLVIVNQLI